MGSSEGSKGRRQSGDPKRKAPEETPKEPKRLEDYDLEMRKLILQEMKKRRNGANWLSSLLFF